MSFPADIANPEDPTFTSSFNINLIDMNKLRFPSERVIVSFDGNLQLLKLKVPTSGHSITSRTAGW